MIKVCILSDYREGFKSQIKNLSKNGDSKFIAPSGEELSFEFRGFDEKPIDCDYVLIINKTIKPHKVRARRVFALQQEPYIKESKQYGIPFKNEWAIKPETYAHCDVVFAFNEGLFKAPCLEKVEFKTALDSVLDLDSALDSSLDSADFALDSNVLKYGGNSQNGGGQQLDNTRFQHSNSPFLNSPATNPNQLTIQVASNPHSHEVDSPRKAKFHNTIFIKYPPMMYFLFAPNMPYNELCNLPIPRKIKEISCIASFDKKAFAGHLDRMKFVKALQNSHLGDKIDFYGNKTPNELAEKKDGILPYKYTIAIENNAQSDYFSEKIMDAYLGYAMPIYFGAGNIERYFPKNSFIKIDIYNVEDSIKRLENLLESNFYEEHFGAILEARRRVLEDYSMLESMGKEILKDYKTHKETPKKEIFLKPYKRSLKTHIWRIALIIYYFFHRILNKGESKNKLKDLKSHPKATL
ncbi:hypothetical protein CCY99_00990 [Helicobacter sp. 16-1353]|uniref:glycosyltransferase family 10 domain-containing protein n=1 Tax=Helicobacter sp. 16-1353 TaxID=2004996 RepID=UPI000DCDFB41|nr:glycosyltransferase family 10 [Helicobacter sp. 16-1353]RAX55307.1 hypothetical protein CCY99_00990 [Helicobacter sp. 16-1353]